VLKRYILICLLIVILIPAKIVVADTSNTPQLAIEVLPSDSLFNITDMKPGDWAPRTVTIKNNGLQEFDYQLRVINDGPDKLFNELLFEVNDQSNEVYDGKLADFETIPLRSLTSSNVEELDLTIRFPNESGNEFQGLHAQFSIVFMAEGKENNSIVASTYIEGIVGSGGEDLRVSGAGLPYTATNIFKFMFIGLLTLAIGGGIFELNRRKMNSLNQ